MLESETSGAPTGRAEIAPPPAAFGARGSGLARGKRPAAPAPATTTASNGEYRPTSIEVVAAKSEYKNPFAETAPAAVVDEVKPIPAAESPAPTASVETKPIQPAFTAPVQPVASTPVQPAAKAQLNILPAEEPKRTELSWETGSPDVSAKTNVRPRREDRPIFRAERPEKNPFEPREQKPFESREQKPFEAREPKPFQPREPRDSREPRREPAFEPRRNLPFEPREPRHKPAAEIAPKKSGGFFGWLKSLFGGSKPAATNGTATPAGEPGREGDQRQNRRRHRGGRGGQGGHYRQGDPSRGEGNRGGFRNGQPQGEGRRESNGEHREGGQGAGGQRRRRRRGGRGGQGGHYRQGDPSRGEGSSGGPQGS
jgi:translation initiation factor IF-2